MIAQEQSNTQAAGFLERLIAYIIDAVILGFAGALMYLLLPVALYYLLSFVLGAAYTVYFWTSSGSTPGKSVMGLQVISASTGQLVDPGQAILRYVGYLVSSIPFGLGFLWIIWDEKHEGWHDKIAKTMVVKAK
jgi:uncharacterized RDD family membrane protein YckC